MPEGSVGVTQSMVGENRNSAMDCGVSHLLFLRKINVVTAFRTISHLFEKINVVAAIRTILRPL